MGRGVRSEDYAGVHTSTDFDLAAVYAYGAWHTVRKREPDAYPVVLALDTRGLEALPDVDALVNAAQLLGDESVRADLADAEISLHEAPDWWEIPLIEVFEGADVSSALVEVSQEKGPWGAFETEEEWERWLSTGEYTKEQAIRLTDQKRYLDDFGLDRLVQAVAIQPWWPEIMEIYDEQSECVAQALEDAGWAVVTIDDLIGGYLPIKKHLLYGPTDTPQWAEFHGTSSYHLHLAFPELELPENPFPVQDVDLDEICG